MNRMIIAIVVSFFITWLPNQTLTIYMLIKPDGNMPVLSKISPMTQVTR